MSRYTGPRLRVVRRLGGIELPGLVVPRELRRRHPPGQHGPTQRIKLSDYAIRLREKQKLRFHYGVSEVQFRRYVRQAKRTKGNTGETMLILLESRLDNVVYRLGFARTLRQARQMVRHGHIDLDGKRVSIPSYHVSAGSVIAVRASSSMRGRITESLSGAGQTALPSYLERNDAELKGTMKSRPEYGDCPLRNLNEALVVELYAMRL